jgi:DNA invertase Pin-like site-specific DNA recombinase
METKPLVPAAQYVRMSTEDQQYSIANQQAAIRTYAKSHGYVVASTYADEGKSGIGIKDRQELRRLLSDVMNGRAPFKTILVYDVSRWGRFQDVDEAAHYEFLCRSAGTPVRYCAEQFDNDGSPASSLMKALKRTMAAEYSRELGIKVLAGQRRIALLGFRVVGTAGYGFRRMMVSPDGRRRLVLKDGERKAIHTDRTILVPGPQKEVACIRAIFELAAAGETPKEIAKELNMRHMLPSNERSWGRSSIYRILTNEKYAGCNTYGKTTQKLGSGSRVVERHLWVTHPDAFVSIVERDVFDRVQKLLKKRGAAPERSDAYLIRGMKKVLAREGKLTHRILKEKGILGCAYYRRFGSVMKAYEMAGYRPPSRTVRLSDAQICLRLLRRDFYTQLKQLFSNRVRFIGLPRQQLKQIVEIDGRLRIAVYLCRISDKMKGGEFGWVLRLSINSERTFRISAL